MDFLPINVLTTVRFTNDTVKVTTEDMAIMVVTDTTTVEARMPLDGGNVAAMIITGVVLRGVGGGHRLVMIIVTVGTAKMFGEDQTIETVLEERLSTARGCEVVAVVGAIVDR